MARASPIGKSRRRSDLAALDAHPPPIRGSTESGTAVEAEAAVATIIRPILMPRGLGARHLEFQALPNYKPGIAKFLGSSKFLVGGPSRKERRMGSPLPGYAA